MIQSIKQAKWQSLVSEQEASGQSNDNRSREVELKERLSIGMDWTAESKSIFATCWTANEIPVVLGVEPNGNHRVLLEGERAAPFWWAIPSPGGCYLALEVVIRENNFWMVENF